MRRPVLLDLFCGAGGAAEGFHRAGFEVVGVDIAPQPNYPFRFVQADALRFLSWWIDQILPEEWWPDACPEFVAIHASCPCQFATRAQKLQGNEHPNLIEPTRKLLEEIGLPYVIENVPGAPLILPIALEGTMFPGLRTLRTRLFETNWPLHPPNPIYEAKPHTKMGRPRQFGEWMHVVGNFSGVEEGRRAMGIHWMTRNELSEAVPPAYTEYIGWELRDYLRKQEAQIA